HQNYSNWGGVCSPNWGGVCAFCVRSCLRSSLYGGERSGLHVSFSPDVKDNEKDAKIRADERAKTYSRKFLSRQRRDGTRFLPEKNENMKKKHEKDERERNS